MRRTPIELAAVATAAVPGLTPTAVASAPDDPADFDSALLVDSEGKRWRVRSPRHPEASARLETEFVVLRAFAPAIRAELPFQVPNVAGTVRHGSLSTFVYSHLPGATRTIEELSAGSDSLAKEIGTALAAVHDLPRSLVNNADLPSYTANEFRQRKLNELDQAATTGKIPPALLLRWEHALEDVSLWRFNPCVVHGDLHEDNLLVDEDAVTALTGWTDLRIGDPADDMAWLVASNEQTFVDSVLRHYKAARRDTPDAHLLRRASLLAEFALAQYLVKALAAGHAEMIAEAEEMLASLAEDVAVHGGHSISVEPIPATPAAPPASASGTTQTAGTGGLPAVSVGPVPAVSVSPVPAVSVTPLPADEVPGEQPPAEQQAPAEESRPAPAEEPESTSARAVSAEEKPNDAKDIEHLASGDGAADSSRVNRADGNSHSSDGSENSGDSIISGGATDYGNEGSVGPSPDDTSTAALNVIEVQGLQDAKDR